MCNFVSPVTAYINGSVVTERLDWDAVYANSNVVYIYYTFIKGASAPEIEISLPGDINSDGSVNLKDVVLLARYVAGWENLTVNEAAIDINGDGLVDLNDVNHLARYLAGWKDSQLSHGVSNNSLKAT